MSNSRAAWWRCPGCGERHYIKPAECRNGSGSGPYCSRCRLRGRLVLLARQGRRANPERVTRGGL